MADLPTYDEESKPEANDGGDGQTSIATPRSWVVPVTTAVLLVGTLCLYYFVYVGTRREYLINRNFRALAALGDQLQRVVSTHASILEFYSDLASGSQAPEHGLRKEDLSKFLLVRPEDEGMKPKAREEESRKDYMRFLAPQMELISVGIGPNPQASKPPLRLDVQRHNGRWDLVLGAARHQDSDKDYLGSLEIAELLKLPAGSLPFDDILLVSEDGKVVYQEKRAGPQFTTLASLLKAQVTPADSKPGGPDSQSGASGGQKPQPPWQAASMHLTDVMLTGSRYKLFLQPVLIDIFTDEPTHTEPAREWVLCGLRSSSGLEWEALSISYTSIIWITALFLAICMGGPVLKVIFMNQRERFRLRELGFLSLFLVLLAGVFTLTALEVVHFRAANEIDAQLERLAGTLSKNVHDDLLHMREQLMEWCATDALHHDLQDASDHEVIRNIPALGIDSSSVKRAPVPGKYPFLGNVFWTDDDGHQVVKWSTSGYVTPMIDVSGQKIYEDPKRTYLDATGPPFHFDSILPPNKLEYLAAMAIGTEDCSPGLAGVRGDVKGGTAIAAGQPFSLVDPILPFGYGFALIDDTGRVLFDSDKTKNGRENFLEESEGNKELYAGTFGHATSQSLSINYLGKDYRARVVPVQGITQAPWSLIVIADLSAERTLALQTMTMASTLLLLILAGPALVALIWSMRRRPRFAPEWLWPNPHRMATYLYQICLYSVLTGVFLFVGFHGPSEQIVIACAAVPYSALLLTFWCYRRYSASAEPGGHPDGAASDVLPAAVTVLSVGVFLLVLLFHWSHLKGLAALLLAVAFAVVPLLDGPRRYIQLSTLRRRRRRLQTAGRRSGSDRFVPHISGYAVSVLLLLLLIGILTPMALFRGCLAVERRLGVKQAQLHFASALTERWTAIQDKCETGDMGDAACKALKDGKSGAWSTIIPNAFPVKGSQAEITHHSVPAGEELYENWFRSLIYLLHHEYNVDAAETLGVLQDRVEPKPGRSFPDWSWENGPSSVRLRWHGVHPWGEDEAVESDLLVTSDLPMTLYGDMLSGTGIAAGVLLLIGGVVWMLVRKVFLIHVAPLKMTGVREVAERIRQGRNVLILVPPSIDFEVDSPAKILDLRAMAGEAKWAETVDLEDLPLNAIIEIRHFEFSSDTATLEQKVLLVERLVLRERTQIAAIMEVPASTEDYRRLFPQLTVVDLREEPFLWLKQYEGPAQSLIWRECRPMAALWPLGAQLAKEIRSEANISDDTVASEILERADPYYHLVWKECTDEQKFVLSQLAEDGLMNPMNGRAIRQLIRRGVIVQEPEFRIMNESFRRFLRSATTAEMKQRWLAASRRSGWGKMHGAFFTIMVVLGVFLLTTQNSLWQSSAAYVTTAFGALGTLSKLFNTYRGAVTGEKAN
jgi:hypothetical protein